MIQYQLKLKLTPRQGRQLDHWLRHLAAVWNWAIRKTLNDARDGFTYAPLSFRSLLNGHGRKIGIPQDAINGTLATVHIAWQRHLKKLAGKPRLKGHRNRLNSIAFGHGATIKNGRIQIHRLGWVRFHKQLIPEGRIGQIRLIKRSSGWYACLWIQATPNPIQVTAINAVGIDPGFTSLLTLSTGEKVAHPRELELSARRLAQAQRGADRVLAARINERIANQRKDRNHKLSRKIVTENQLIAFSADNHSAIARRFGKSVTSSSHYQLRSMLAYKSKCRTDGLGIYVEPSSKNSTKTCSACGALSGPTGLSGLKVRQWDCSACGAHHDRDINAAINTLIAGAGLAHETLAKVT